MSETKKARCPVCRRVVTVTATGALRTHGNKDFAGWAQCSKVAYRGISADWTQDAEGILHAPAGTAQRLWDPRAAVEAWAPSTLHRLKVYELINTLSGEWNELNAALIHAREEQVRMARVVDNTNALTQEVVRDVVGPVVAEQMGRYRSADVVTDAVVAALMQWMEADHEQA